MSATRSIPIRRALREERAIGSRFIDDTGDRGSRKESGAVSANRGKSIAEGMYPICIEERWGRRTIRERKVIAFRPGSRRKLPVEPRCVVNYMDWQQEGVAIKNGVSLERPTPPGYRTDGGVGWLAGARFS